MKSSDHANVTFMECLQHVYSMFTACVRLMTQIDIRYVSGWQRRLAHSFDRADRVSSHTANNTPAGGRTAAAFK